MKCSKCGKEVESTWSFCPYCKAEITANVTTAEVQPQPPVQQVAYAPVQVVGKKNDGLCIASMVLGICGIFPFYPLGIILGTLAIVFWKKGKDNLTGNQFLKGAGMATAGLVCGIIGVVISVGFWIVIIVAATSTRTTYYPY